MKVIVPVAGVGKRLRPHTDSLPKPLIEVGGRPILDYVLSPLMRLNVDEVVLVIGHLGDQIREYVRAKHSFKARFVEQDQLLGLGYAVEMALRKIDGGPVLIVLGDTIVDCDLQEFVAAGEYVMGVHEVTDPHRFGIVEVNEGHITAVEEKPAEPKSNLALIGLYYFSESERLKKHLVQLVASGRTTSGEIQLTDALAAMPADGIKLTPFNVPHWYDCGTKETLLSTNRFLLDRMDSSGAGNDDAIKPPVFLDKTAVVVDSVVGPYVAVGAGARIRNSTVSNSIVASGAKVIDANIKDSLVGERAVVKSRQGVLNIGEHSESDDD